MKGFAVEDGDKIVQNGVTYTVDQDQTDVSAAAGINVKDSDGNKLKITVNEGATHTTSLGETTTLVGNASTDFTATTALAAPTWAEGDKVVDEDGVEYTYVDVSENAYLNGVKYTADGFYKSEGNTASDTAYTAVAGDTYTIALTGETGSLANKGIVTVDDIKEQIKGLADGKTVQIKDNANATAVTYTVGVTTKDDGSKMTADDIADLVKEGQHVTVDTAVYYAVSSNTTSKTDISIDDAYRMMENELEAASSIGADVDASVLHKGDGVFEITQGKAEIDNALSFALHVGADADMTNKIGVKIQTMSSSGLGVKGLNVKDDSGKAATYAIDAIADAVATVSAQRSLLGAVQNRLEHTINNLDNVVENTTAAESQIRDTDMATEMVKYSNANILSQAGQSMLAQANQSNQGVLSILG
ncbi:MAG: flagellar hook protein [Lachnospiraceae bacterium]|nr:flagellar hook protein [Lachnospiraceae bacterium]